MSQLDELRKLKKLTTGRLDDKTFGDRAKEIRRLEKEAEDKAFNDRRQRNKEEMEKVNAAFLIELQANEAKKAEDKQLAIMKRQQQDERTREMAEEARERLRTEILH